MNEKMIRDAYCKIRTIDNTIPDDVLDFMLEASLQKLEKIRNYDALIIGEPASMSLARFIATQNEDKGRGIVIIEPKANDTEKLSIPATNVTLVKAYENEEVENSKDSGFKTGKQLRNLRRKNNPKK